MKRDTNDTDQLFQSRLTDYEMPVDQGLWDRLEEELPRENRRRKMWYTRVASVASIVLILTVSSAAIWLFSPKEELVQAFSQVEAGYGAMGTPKGDAVSVELPPVPPAIIAAGNPSRQIPATPYFPEMEEDSVSISFSMSISITTTSNTTREAPTDYYQDGQVAYYTQSTGESLSDNQTKTGKTTETGKSVKKRPLVLQAAVGTALPAKNGKHKMPFVVDLTIEKQLTDRLAIESGIQYSLLHSGSALHYIGVPVKLKYTCFQSGKFDLYATLGGAADKCVGGATDISYHAEPIQLAATAGVGGRYRVNEKLELFVEPGVTHHFKTDSETRTVRTERPTNFNLLCGVRMTY